MRAWRRPGDERNKRAKRRRHEGPLAFAEHTMRGRRVRVVGRGLLLNPSPGVYAGKAAIFPGARCRATRHMFTVTIRLPPPNGR